LQKVAVVYAIASFMAKVFGENIFKIITSVPGFSVLKNTKIGKCKKVKETNYFFLNHANGASDQCDQTSL
jgi:hypothetical protein